MGCLCTKDIPLETISDVKTPLLSTQNTPNPPVVSSKDIPGLPQIDTINEIANEQDDALDKCHFKNVIEYAEEHFLKADEGYDNQINPLDYVDDYSNLVKYFAVKQQKPLPHLPHRSIDILEKYLDEPLEYEKSLNILKSMDEYIHTTLTSPPIYNDINIMIED